jgi:hypothetical protein
MRNLFFMMMVTTSLSINASDDYPWYTQGDFTPGIRMEFTVSNPLDFDRQHCPVTIKHENFPMPDIHEMWITVVDPEGLPFEGPSEELLRLQNGHQLREETNGQAVFHRLADCQQGSDFCDFYRAGLGGAHNP